MNKMNWGLEDFLAAGALLFTAGVLVVLALRSFQRPGQRAMAVAAVILLLALVWAELAVGIFH